MEHRLHELATSPIQIIWHENTSSYLSVRKLRGVLCLRVHRLFFNAPTPVLEALLKYAQKRDAASRAIIRQMAHLHFSQTHIPPEPLKSQGEVYNLQEIFDRIALILPVGEVSIGWSQQKRFGKFRSITFGCFDKHRRQIRINPLLDCAGVPLYFLEFIVYHEMLHAVCPTKMGVNGQCSIHTKEFREKERLFPRFKEAKEWEKKSLIFFKRKSHGRS
jgi:hypothetical protein